MRKVLIVCAVLGAIGVIFIPQPAFAHEEREVGSLSVEVGWRQEPAYTGLRNDVQFIAKERASGNPAEGGELQVVVIFGGPDGTQQTPPIALLPTEENPGAYDGAIIPTRPGTFTFHITGTVGGQAVDELFTSGEQTFDDVVSAADAEFPAKDPGAGDLAVKLDRVVARVTAAGDDARSAGDRASLALWLAIGGVSVGAAGLIAAGAAVGRARGRA